MIRSEIPNDVAQIQEILEVAFGRSEEANLVTSLRHNNGVTLSLVAVKDDKVVGHILFSPVILENSSIKAVGLAPLAVLPAYQKQGIGSQLVQKGLSECQKAGIEIVVVLGEPKFYTRFGFQPSILSEIRYDENVPPEFFMIKELQLGALFGQSGVIHYRAEFKDV